MEREELEKKIEQLEIANREITLELCYYDKLMRLIGFSQGLSSVKASAKEIAAGKKQGKANDWDDF